MSKKRMALPRQIDELRSLVRRTISPIKQMSGDIALRAVSFAAQRTDAGRGLPPYYLVYFLLVDLLGFRRFARFEKVAWSIPIEFEGTPYWVDHRKLGVGLFCENAQPSEPQAERIVSLVTRGVREADPFFRWLAENAVRESRINVRNNSAWLFRRYEYLRDQFRKAVAEAKSCKEKASPQSTTSSFVTMYDYPGNQLIEARWIGIAAIDAFFAWTEHVFVLLAIIQGRVTTGDEVADLIEADWHTKFKQALELTTKESKMFYDRLSALRRQTRNYMAHGAFGKQGEAFDFHSGVGAVPVLFDHRSGMSRFSFIGEPAFEEIAAISTIEEFVSHVWLESREPAWLYIQGASLPLILTLVGEGSYQRAMRSVKEMERFVDDLTRHMDDAANMDW